MITQEITSIKTWGEFNLTILKVNLNTLLKNQSFTITTQTTNILLLPTSRNLLTRPRASSETIDSFFLDSSATTSTPAHVSLSSLVQQLNDHQVLNEISFLIILSMCKGNHLQILQEIHTHSKQSNKVLRELLEKYQRGTLFSL